MGCNFSPILNPFTGRLQLIGTVSSSGSTVATPASILAKAVASSVASNVKTTVVTYTASADTYITELIGSGMEYGKWFVVVDSVDQAVRRGGSDRDVVWTFVNPLKINSGSVIDLKVEHFVSGQTPDFEGTIMGYE